MQLRRYDSNHNHVCSDRIEQRVSRRVCSGQEAHTATLQATRCPPSRLGVTRRMLGRLVLLFWIPFVHGTCNISLSLAPSASTFQFGGSVVQPLAAPLALVPPTLVTGLQGNVLLLLSDVDACPTTGEGVLAALPGATLSTTNATGRLAMYPTTVLVRSVCGLV